MLSINCYEQAMNWQTMQKYKVQINQTDKYRCFHTRVEMPQPLFVFSGVLMLLAPAPCCQPPLVRYPTCSDPL